MALVLNERVKETTTTTGTGALSLGGASDGFETFAAGIGNSNTTYYAIFHATADEFEVGLGTLDGDSSDLTRTTVYASSNSDNAVNFSAGTKTVFCTMPAARSVFLDADGDVTLGANLDVGGNLTVTGTTTFNGGTLTLGDANTDNIVFGGEVDSNIIPDDDNTYDLGSSSKEWKDIYIDGVAYVDAINFAGTAISATAAELNIMDGVTASATDINLIDGITNGTVIASKAIITDSNKDITGGRNITISGELDAATLDISGDADIDGTLEADAITVNGTALASVIAGTTVTLASTVTVTDSTANTNFPVVFHNESNALLDDTGALRYNPSTGELLVPKLTVAGTTTTVDTVTMNAANAIIFEGATADAHETTLTIIDPTGDRTINLPNVSGTIPVLAAVSTTQITSTPEELNILDGVTSTAAELNILDGVTSTAAELNILDGVTSTAAELNILDGKAFLDEDNMASDSATGIASQQSIKAYVDANAGGLSLIDEDNMASDSATRPPSQQSVKAFVENLTGTNIVATGALNSGSITSGFGNINTGSSTITTTGEIAAGSLDISGNIDVDGTTNLDVVDIDGAVDMASTLTVAGDVTLTGASNNAVWDSSNNSLDFADSAQLRFGAGADLKIFHDGSDSHIVDSGTGNLKISTSALQIMNAAGNENLVLGTADGAVTLYHDNSAKLATTSTGVDVTGAIVTDAGGTIGAAGTATSVAGITFFQGDTGSIYTHDVSGTDDTAQYNTGYGLTALDAITTGDNNTAIGYSAGTAITTGATNTAIGYIAGSSINTGNNNTALGAQALENLESGSDNSAGGSGGLNALTTGSNNTAFGRAALGAVNTASNNTALGYHAGLGITTGTDNIAIGYQAIDAADTEDNNLAIGKAALGGAVAGGENNVAVGNYTLDALTSGDDNVAVGYQAGTALQAGAYNVAVGRDALSTAQGDRYNVAVGYEALKAFNTGTSVNDTENVAVGVQAGLRVNTGSANTIIGGSAGNNITSGSNNTCLGQGAGGSSSPSNITTSSNSIVLGNNNVTDASIKVDWTVTSDKRDKTDVEALTMGLDFVNQLNPVTYRWDMRSDYENKTPDGTHKKSKLSSGLLAQDVEVLEREYGYKVEDETALITSKGEDGNYGLTYSKFVPVLINAVQELSATVTTLQQEIKILKEGL